MKPFNVITIPHEDILEGKLTMDIFAADLWQVYKGNAPDEYNDSDLFFAKTYETTGLKNLLEVVEKRIKGEGGDSTIQLETPFGGGKTHSLIALFHKTKEWSSNVSVMVGTNLDAEKYTLWGFIEEQLTGKISSLNKKTSPGKEELRSLLEQYQPLTILMDEVLQYMTKASGIKVEDSNLASQTLAFLQELTELVATLKQTCLVVTLPSSTIEHYGEKTERYFQQLKQVFGRLEKVYTPVQEQEVSHIVRKRLFTDINHDLLKKNVIELYEYFKKEDILPSEVDPSIYKEKLMNSYPFLPDVLDCIYHRWGSYPTFQRTRGLLRLFSLVIYPLLSANTNYISLADFDLSSDDLRRELLKHIGNEYDSVVAADITDVTSNSKKVDKSLTNIYQSLKIGYRIANSIFLYSFSGGQERGATIQDIKRSATLETIPSAIIGDTLTKMENQLFYIHKTTDKYLFTTEPNLNRVILTKMDNVEEDQILEMEYDLLTKILKGSTLTSYIWPKNESDIPDNKQHKLVILQEGDKDFMEKILEYKGKTFPRVYRNTIYFLTSSESKRFDLHNAIKRSIAWEMILKDIGLRLKEEQKKNVQDSAKKAKETVSSMIREFYRYLLIPDKKGYDNRDLGIPAYGTDSNLGKDVFNLLMSENIIVQKIAPKIFELKYLKDKTHVNVKQIFESSLTTRGETRLLNSEILSNCINEGVKHGDFGLGVEVNEDEHELSYWKEEAIVTFSDEEVILNSKLSEKLIEPSIDDITKEDVPLKDLLSKDVKVDESQSEDILNHIDLLDFVLPKGKTTDILGMINYIQTKFDRTVLSIRAFDGNISRNDYEDKIEETLKQLGIKISKTTTMDDFK